VKRDKKKERGREREREREKERDKKKERGRERDTKTVIPKLYKLVDQESLKNIFGDHKISKKLFRRP
jgi:hypothetical protein